MYIANFASYVSGWIDIDDTDNNMDVIEATRRDTQTIPWSHGLSWPFRMFPINGGVHSPGGTSNSLDDD